MLFNSDSFLFEFLPVVLAGFFATKNLFGGRAAQFWLAGFSVVFYTAAGLSLLPPLLLSIFVNFLTGRALTRRHLRGESSVALLFAGVAFNLVLLGWFKYADFAVANLDLFGLHLASPGIALPLGISFYTFTQIAFLADAARGLAREYDILRYVLFVTFFPHLIAGPIIHHREMMPQFAPERLTARIFDHLPKALTLFSIGLAKKMLLADSFAALAQPVFNNAAQGLAPDAIAAWGATLAYTFQIYFDFSGYSDMALALALMFGIRLPVNFLSPYKSHSIVEFWRSWHMTLSRFLRDYVYIPLGGNRHGPWRRYANLITVMTVGGLWHGAGWTFLVWGALHGIYLLVNHAWRAAAARWRLAPLSRGSGRLITFMAVALAWVLFRADSFAAARMIYAAMFGLNGIAISADVLRALGVPNGLDLGAIRIVPLLTAELNQPLVILWCLAGLAFVWLLPNSMELTGFAPLPGGVFARKLEFRAAARFAVASAVCLFACIAVINSGAPSAFIYYRF
jgi:alginate O-acetyltransferase complex protein AlgI